MAKLTIGQAENQMVIEGTTEELTDFMKTTAELFEVETEDETVEVETAEEAPKASPEFEVGDLALISVDANPGALSVGDIVEIIGKDTTYDFKTRRIIDGVVEYFDTHELLPYEPAEKSLQVGDKVALAIPKGKMPFHGFGRVKNGDIGEVTMNNGEMIRFNFEEHSGWNGLSSEVIIVEKAEQVEGSPKFSVGDTVKVVGRTCYGNISEGTLVKITEDIDKDGDYMVGLLDGSDYDYTKPSTLEKVSDIADPGDIVRITVDKAGAKVGEIVEVSSVEDGKISYPHHRLTRFEFVGEHGTYEIVAKKSARIDV